jgi:hypothetical protein
LLFVCFESARETESIDVMPATGVMAWTLVTAVIGFRAVWVGPFMQGVRAVEVLLFAATLGARDVLRVVAGLDLLGTTAGRC